MLTDTLTAPYVIGRSGLSAAAHQQIVRDLQYEQPHHFLPGASLILSDAAVLDATQQVLGRPPRRDPCRHLHLSGPDDGPWHEDDYCGEPWPEPMAILCYYPQWVTYDMGPTILLVAGAEAPLLGPAGTFCVMRHDATHRAGANRTVETRYMMKFLFGGGER